MTISKQIFIFLFAMFFVASCSSSRNQKLEYTTENCPSEFQKISFDNLDDAAKKYNNKYIEVVGYFHYYHDKINITSTKRDKGKKINVSYEPFIGIRQADTLIRFGTSAEHVKADKKRVIIRGILDTSDHGWWGEHYFTVKKICYVKILN